MPIQIRVIIQTFLIYTEVGTLTKLIISVDKNSQSWSIGIELF